mmetsp:Transcript_33409/g.55257  ORF Transcript_33409/g.55257 Transcript_33409/m.55257 type:complete len:487 (-) Transcript_33409:98-1558(-)|eukprot:CAMPEP_0119339250 /NCGR_PEP_ID=MMETSP1333-20130426/97888_1 /TAXON_ID=418940 /ORGANISM="Scyphosphaera apsteinii, Strain RCC1455" /LENGTH=486 /DNA_ID=CAMNT_0007350743 /DNA_START=43 /DNA_END=1503 /DNA_ORIENTATION=-
MPSDEEAMRFRYREDAVLRVQAHARGVLARSCYIDMKEEEARQQWVAYYLQLRMYDEARELGWEGQEPAMSLTENEAAIILQSNARGFKARDAYRNDRDEAAREQWVSYYIAQGNYEKARELGWDEEQDMRNDAATRLQSLYRGNLVRTARRQQKASSVGVSPVIMRTKSSVRYEKRSSSKLNTISEISTNDSPPPQMFSPRWFGKIFESFTSNKSPEGDSSEEDDQRDMAAAIILQCWTRQFLARRLVTAENRKFRLFALYAHIEEKNAIKIQTAERRRRELAAAAAAADTAHMSEATPYILDTTEDMSAAPSAFVPASAPVTSSASESTPDAPDPDKEQALASAEATPLSVPSAVPMIHKTPYDIQKAQLMHQLKGSLFKRSVKMPRYQRRNIYLSLHNESDLAICYKVGDLPKGQEKRIPLATCTSVTKIDDLRYEFHVNSTCRAQVYKFRTETSEQLELWVNGLQKLMQHSRERALDPSFVD